MAYYRGHIVRVRGHAHRGYHRGDPGFFSHLFHAVGQAVHHFVPQVVQYAEAVAPEALQAFGVPAPVTQAVLGAVDPSVTHPDAAADPSAQDVGGGQSTPASSPAQANPVMHAMQAQGCGGYDDDEDDDEDSDEE